MPGRIMILLASLLTIVSIASAQDDDPEYKATFSIIARDPATGELGHAETSKALAGGTNFGAAKGGVGVITNQAATFMMYGKIGIQMLEMGFSPEQALQYMLNRRSTREPAGRHHRCSGTNRGIHRRQHQRMAWTQMRRELLRSGQHDDRAGSYRCGQPDV